MFLRAMMRPVISISNPAAVARPIVTVAPRRHAMSHQHQSRDMSTGATVNKKAFIAKVAESHEDLNNKTVETVLNAVLKTITDGVKDGDKIVLTGFGSFEAKVRAARTGRNPKTGEPLDIPETKYPSFTAGKTFKETVKEK